MESEKKREKVVESIGRRRELATRSVNVILDRAGIEVSENILRMRDFVEEVDDGGVPSHSLLMHFAGAFRVYLERHRTDDLIDRLCPPGPEHGKLDYFRTFRKLDQESRVMSAFHLRLCDGDSTRDAAAAVAERDAHIDSPETVRRLYRKKLLAVSGLTWQSVMSEIAPVGAS